MKINLEKKMKAALITFKSKAEIKDSDLSEILEDNRRFLVITAEKVASECRLNKGSDLLPGLFEKCFELCENSAVIYEDTLSEYLEKTDGISAEYIPLALTCALIEYAALAVRSCSRKRLVYAVESLKNLAQTDFDSILKRISRTEKILVRDPSRVYEKMSEETKKLYRRNIAAIALKSEKTEEEIAEKILRKAEKSGRHIGEYILCKKINHRQGILCIAMGFVMPLAVTAALGIFLKDIVTPLLLFFPFREIFRIPIERTLMKGKKPNYLPRMEFSDCKALITVSTLLPPAEKADELKEKLEQHYLSNGSKNVKICCLADFKAADSVQTPEDKTILCSAEKVIDELNKKHGFGFILAVRPRSYSETQNEFIGKERKRGAITELIRAVKGDRRGFFELYGDTEGIDEVKYLIAADWDTEPYFGSVSKLINVAEHPLNKPVVKNGRVVSGYGLLVPEVHNSLRSKFATGFTKLIAGDTGFSSYDSFACEKYQFFFGESIFCGKGLINVDAYYETLNKTLPREQVLSHDTVESGYLRAAYVSDSQFAESFPETVESFYKRMHRWVRGDFQNIGFVFGKNPMNALSRYKIADNICRDLHAPICVAAIIFSAFIRGDIGVIMAVISLFALCCNYVYSAIFSAENGFSKLGFSGASSPAFEHLIRAFLSLSFAAKEAYFCADAAVKALWRLLVSGNRLLEWQTYANSEKSSNINGSAVLCIPSVVAAAVLFVFGLPIHRLAAMLFLADIPLTVFSGAKPKKSKVEINENDRKYLISYAKLMWNYFDDLCTRKSNFLPPDNIRFSPSKVISKKTSPTNIGLMLASFLAARDFGFISSQELYMRLNLSLKSVEKLEKFSGNLLNWYSTETLEAISPRFVSTVDSGNFLCCLTALKEGLYEYVSECDALKNIIVRIEKIIDETDLSVLYNCKKELFHIGVYPDSGEKTKSCYDLFMSEMRMTSYLAVARREVPQNHWSALGRIGISQGRYSGLASWTGTMFEYFMPEIFIPSPVGSLSSEALSFCIYCQKKQAGKRPFGASESGFYAFDSNLNYCYKAHGVSALALKNGDNREKVISPYSSFLTLTSAPKSSVKNLKKLEKSGVCGKYGFFEAVDFTNGFNVIRSFMSHHVGMSFLSVLNALDNNRMQNRFMCDLQMKGAKTLLDEKADIIASEDKSTVMTRDNCCAKLESAIYSNGKLTQCFTSDGNEALIFDGIRNDNGIFVTLETENERFYFGNSDSKLKHLSDFSRKKAVFTSSNKNIELKSEITLAKKQNFIKRTLTIENKDKSRKFNGALRVYFNTNGREITDKNGCIITKYKAENSEYYLAVGFADSVNISKEDNVFIGNVELDECEKRSFQFVVAAGDSEETVLGAFEASKQNIKSAERIMADDTMLTALSEKILPRILFDFKPINSIIVTGDIPIIAIKAGEENAENFVVPFLRLNKNLRSIGIKNDLVIIFDRNFTNENKIKDAIKNEESELMLGVKGGVHLVDISSCGVKEIENIINCSCFFMGYESDK